MNESFLDRFTIIIPAYNEEKGLGSTLQDLKDFNSKLNILVINDGSKDRTLEVAQQFSNVRIISHRKNRGYGASLKTGVAHCRTEYLVTYDADGQHRPEDAINVIKKCIEEDADLIIGRRGKDSYQVPLRKPGKWVLGKVANFLAQTKIPDLNSGLRAFKKKSIAPYLHIMPQGFSFSTTSTLALYKMGMFVDYEPIVVQKRTGTSTVKMSDGFDTLILIIRLMVLFNPMRVFIPPCVFLVGVGIIKAIFWDLMWRQAGVATSSVLVVTTGVLVFCFGILADQVASIRLEMGRLINQMQGENEDESAH